MTRFMNDKSCGRLAPGEHLAERDWVIGSEVEKCPKVSYPYAVGKGQVITGGGGIVVDKTQSHNQAAGHRNFRVSGQTRVSVLSCSASCKGGLCTCWPTKNDGLLIRIGGAVTFCRATCDGRVRRG
jgi:hypothetical protein